MRARTFIGMGALALALTGASLTQQAGAQDQPVVTDYDNYPANALANPDCDASGVHGAEYSVNGARPIFDLRDLPPLQAGDTIDVSWTDINPVCDDSIVSLALRESPTEVFDPNVDQTLTHTFVWRTLDVNTGGRLSYTLPLLAIPCTAQLDFVVGPPLMIVGPSGSFYGSTLRGAGPHLLISAWNGVYEQCVVPTPVTEPPTTTTTVTETPTTLPVVVAPTTTVASEPTPTTAMDMTNIAAARPAFTTATDQRLLASTGPNWTLILGWIGAIAFCAGMGLVAGVLASRMGKR